MATLRDVARRAGVSISTVSHVINGRDDIPESTANRVRQAIEELEYRPNRHARSLTTNKGERIGLVIEAPNWYYSPIHGALFAGVAEGLHATDYAVDLIHVSSVSGSLKAEWNSRYLEGLIVLPADLSERTVEAIEAFRAPVIVIDKHWNSKRIRFVSSQNHNGGRLAAHHLLQGGCKRIAFVGARNDHTSLERQRGFESALAGANLGPFAPEFTANADWHFDIAYEAAAAWFALSPDERPDGVFCASDTMALAVTNAALDRGLAIPDDVSVIGFDDIPLAHQVRPPLTTIRQDAHRIGRRAVEMLFAMIGGGAVENDDIPVELIVRESTRRL